MTMSHRMNKLLVFGAFRLNKKGINHPINSFNRLFQQAVNIITISISLFYKKNLIRLEHYQQMRRRISTGNLYLDEIPEFQQ